MFFLLSVKRGGGLSQSKKSLSENTQIFFTILDQKLSFFDHFFSLRGGCRSCPIQKILIRKKLRWMQTRKQMDVRRHKKHNSLNSILLIAETFHTKPHRNQRARLTFDRRWFFIMTDVPFGISSICWTNWGQLRFPTPSSQSFPRPLFSR